MNTFTRLWLGVRSPSSLHFTCPDLEAPPDLLARLDRVLLLPPPAVDWGFQGGICRGDSREPVGSRRLPRIRLGRRPSV